MSNLIDNGNWMYGVHHTTHDIVVKNARSLQTVVYFSLFQFQMLCQLA